MRWLSNQFPNWLTSIQERHGTVEVIVEDHRLCLDPQVMVNCGGDVLRVEGAIHNVFASRT